MLYNVSMISNFSNPKENIKYLNLNEGDVVADFGSGSGHYIYPLSEIVGENGKVYGVDIQKSLLMKIQSDLIQKSIQNIEIIWGNVEKPGGSKIREGSLNALVASNILFQVEDKKGFVDECFRVLKKGGQLLLVDWTESFGGLGPQPGHVVDEKTAQSFFEEAGFVLKESVPAGSHHYGMILKKN